MSATNLDDYLLEHMSPEHPYLHRLYRATHTHLLRPRMASGPLQGKLLTLLCRMLRPQTVVEIGTYSGYSALAMAAGMPEGSFIALIGTLSGLAIGVTLVLLQQEFGLIRMGDGSNFITPTYPVSLHLTDTLIIFATSLGVGCLSVWYTVRTLSRRFLQG